MVWREGERWRDCAGLRDPRLRALEATLTGSEHPGTPEGGKLVHFGDWDQGLADLLRNFSGARIESGRVFFFFLLFQTN